MGPAGAAGDDDTPQRTVRSQPRVELGSDRRNGRADDDLPSVALRSANFRLQGTGQGAVSPSVYLSELPFLVDEINEGAIAVTTNTRPLADVEKIWNLTDVPGQRTVLVP